LKQRDKENRPALIQDLLSSWVDGKSKLYVTYKGLSFRRSHRSLFEGGNYLPIDASDGVSEHVCAFVRQKGEAWALVAVPPLIPQFLTPHRPPLAHEHWQSGA